MNKSLNKKMGISLLTLILTIVVGIVLASTVIFSSYANSNKAKLVAYGEDLKTIEEKTAEYYINSGEFPVLDAYSTAMDLKQVLTLAGREFGINESDIINGTTDNPLITEMKDNNETNDSKFYQIDLGKLDITKSKRGTKSKDVNDVYVVAYPSMNVYYLRGLKVSDNIYFSLGGIGEISNKPVSLSKITNTSVSGLAVMSLRKAYSNNLGVSINYEETEDSSLYLSLGEGTQREVVTETLESPDSIQVVNLNSFSDIEEVTNTEIGEAEIASFYSLDESEQTLEIIKKEYNEEVGRVSVDISSYDVLAPSIVENSISIVSGETENILEFQVEDQGGSGVSQVRYEYIQKYDYNLNSVAYSLDNPTYSENYLKTDGKKAEFNAETGTVKLTVPKDVIKIQVAIIDKASNVGIEEIETKLNNYLTYVPIEISKKKAIFKIITNSVHKIATLKSYISIDDGEYVDEMSYAYNSEAGVISSIKWEYYDNLQNPQTSVKIKLQAFNNQNKLIESRIIEFDVTDKSENELIYGLTFMPDGFKYKLGDIGTGIVVEDKNENEFVFIPVDNNTITFKQGIENDETKKYADGEDAFIQNVNLNGGFYVSRYEIGVALDTIQYEEDTLGSGTLFENTAEPMSKAGLKVWNNITLEKAKDIAENMYPGKSRLMSSYAYDTTMNYIIKNIFNNDTSKIIVDSENLGNYLNSEYAVNLGTLSALYQETDNFTCKAYGVLEGNKTKDVSMLLTTGAGQNTSIYNIYDLAGNVAEWTTEHDGESYVLRGGDFTKNSSEAPVKYGELLASKVYSSKVGFRVVLYK